VGTTDRHYLYAPDGRVALFTGSDGDVAGSLELHAPAAEIARMATIFKPDVARVESDRRRIRGGPNAGQFELDSSAQKNDSASPAKSADPGAGGASVDEGPAASLAERTAASADEGSVASVDGGSAPLAGHGGASIIVVDDESDDGSDDGSATSVRPQPVRPRPEYLKDLNPYLLVQPAAWPVARRVVFDAWGIDIANHPLVISTESKYTIDVESASLDVLTEVRARALALYLLAERVGEVRKPWRRSAREKGHLSIDYYNWPGGVDEALHRLLLDMGTTVAAEIAAHPSRWKTPVRRSPWLYGQHEADRRQPVPDARDLRAWRPEPDGLEEIRRTRVERWSGRGQSLYPADDAGLAAFAEHDLRLDFGSWPVSMGGPLGTLLDLAQKRVARGGKHTSSPGGWGMAPAFGPATLAEEEEATKAIVKVGWFDRSIARAYLVSREHNFAMLAVFGYTTEFTANQDLLDGRVIGFTVAVSPALPLPDYSSDTSSGTNAYLADDSLGDASAVASSGHAASGAASPEDEALIAALDALPWTLDRGAAGSDVQTRSLASIVASPRMYLKRGVVQFDLDLSIAPSDQPVLRANEKLIGRDEQVAVPALLDLDSLEATPHIFEFDVATGTRALDLALVNIESSLNFYITDIDGDLNLEDGVQGDEVLGDEVVPAVERAAMLARLRSQAAVVNALRRDLRSATWKETASGFAFAATLITPDGQTIVLDRAVNLDLGPEESPIAARTQMQRLFINGGFGDLTEILNPDHDAAQKMRWAILTARRDTVEAA
jgi:hypothetical protein